MQPIVQDPKKKQSAYTNTGVLESLRDLGSGVAKDALASLFGVPSGGDLKPPQPMTEAYPERPPLRPAMRRPEVYQPIIAVHREEAGIIEKLDVVRMELRTLAATIKKFNSQIERAIEDIPSHPGTYHLNFLERLRGVIMVLRQNIEDSQSWLALWTSRKEKRKYWGMYKKHGTSFGLSSERNVSTQAG